MFKVKCVKFQDKDGNPYQYEFRARQSYMSSILFIILTIGCIFVALYLFKYYPNVNDKITMISMVAIASFICFCISFEYRLKISITIRLDSMMHVHGKTVENNYFSKNIHDDIAKFLTDVGISDNSQKEEPS